MKTVRLSSFWIFVLLLGLIPLYLVLHQEKQAGDVSSELMPSDNPEKILIETQGEQTVYYALRAGKPLSMIVNGPTFVKVITRLDVTDLSKKDIPYAVHVKSDAGLKTYEKKSNISSLSKYADTKQKGFPAQGRKIGLLVPEGRHRFLLSLDEKAPYLVSARFLYKPNAKRIGSAWKKFLPQNHEAVSLFDGHSEVSYYLCKQETPLRFEVTGPRRVKVLTRVLFDENIQLPSLEYSVNIFEGQAFKFSHLFIAKVSKTAKIAEGAKDLKLVGVPKKFYISVPGGRHLYSLSCGKAKAMIVRLWVHKSEESHRMPNEGEQ